MRKILYKLYFQLDIYHCLETILDFSILSSSQIRLMDEHILSTKSIHFLELIKNFPHSCFSITKQFKKSSQKLYSTLWNIYIECINRNRVFFSNKVMTNFRESTIICMNQNISVAARIFQETVILVPFKFQKTTCVVSTITNSNMLVTYI